MDDPADQTWQLYKKHPGWVLGFHGCDEAVGESVLAGSQEHLKSSHNEYDWLGSGIYFGENSPSRAMHFAEEGTKPGAKNTKGKISKPFVIGAIIDLGHCLNLHDSAALSELKAAHDALEKMFLAANSTLPRNLGLDKGARYLDRAVIEAVHQFRKTAEQNGKPGLQQYDSVRAGFWEGDDLYPNAGFSAKSHIQIAIRNHDCIKGYFRPIRSKKIPDKSYR